MARKKKPAPRTTRPASAGYGRTRDPRSYSRQNSRTAWRNRSRFTFEDFKAPLIVLGALAAFTLVYFVFKKTVIEPRSQSRKFNACFQRLRDVRLAMEKNREGNPGYSVVGLYKHMNKPTDIDVELGVEQVCDSHAGAKWTLLADVAMDNRSGFIIKAVAPTEPPCLIQMTGASYWPQDFTQCGTPPPPGQLDAE